MRQMEDCIFSVFKMQSESAQYQMEKKLFDKLKSNESVVQPESIPNTPIE